METTDPAKRVKPAVQVGWFLDVEKAGTIYADPVPVAHLRPKHHSSKKSPDYCPAFQYYNRNLFALLAPYTLVMTCHEKASSFEFSIDSAASTISAAALRSVLVVDSPMQWRASHRPIIQLACPYVFVSDDDVVIQQFTPTMHYSATSWPGLVIPGEFPIRNWVRPLSWAFEWYDLRRPLVITEGQPWCYVRFFGLESSNIKLARIEQTPEITNYQKEIKDVARFTNRTFDLMSRAAARRPERLLPPTR